PLRTPSRSVSSTCVKRVIASNPKVAAPALTECAQRKIAFSASLSDFPACSDSSVDSSISRCSAASWKKVSRNRLRSICMTFSSYKKRLLRSRADHKKRWSAPRGPMVCYTQHSYSWQDLADHLQELVRVKRLDHPCRRSRRASLLPFGL